MTEACLFWVHAFFRASTMLEMLSLGTYPTIFGMAAAWNDISHFHAFSRIFSFTCSQMQQKLATGPPPSSYTHPMAQTNTAKLQRSVTLALMHIDKGTDASLSAALRHMYPKIDVLVRKVDRAASTAAWARVNDAFAGVAAGDVAHPSVMAAMVQLWVAVDAVDAVDALD